MRIVAGDWRGRKLVAPKGEATRPTADRTRETLFNMLVSRLGSFEGLSVADLFAGSGALGLEALSRGAASATFVDSSAAATRFARGHPQGDLRTPRSPRYRKARGIANPANPANPASSTVMTSARAGSGVIIFLPSARRCSRVLVQAPMDPEDMSPARSV